MRMLEFKLSLQASVRVKCSKMMAFIVYFISVKIADHNYVFHRASVTTVKSKVWHSDWPWSRLTDENWQCAAHMDCEYFVAISHYLYSVVGLWLKQDLVKHVHFFEVVCNSC